MAEKKDEKKSAKATKTKNTSVKTAKKKITKKEIEEVKEDKEIKKIANSCNYCQSSSFCVLLILLAIVLLFVVTLIAKNYWLNHYNISSGSGGIKNNVLIVNNGDVKKTINNETFNEENQIVITNINSIELTTNKDAVANGKVMYDVRYEVNKNNFKKNAFANSNSEVIVKFSYSYDGMNWTYTNNALTTEESTINPLIGNIYDIAGVTGTIKVSTNNKLEAQINESKIIYWRSETIFQRSNDKDSGGDFDAVFKIEYKNN